MQFYLACFPPSLSLLTHTHTHTHTHTAGELTAGETAITVTHTSGHYTLSLLDHVRVRIGVESSHAHGPSIRLTLASCTTVAPDTSLSHSHKSKNEVRVYSVYITISEVFNNEMKLDVIPHSPLTWLLDILITVSFCTIF